MLLKFCRLCAHNAIHGCSRITGDMSCKSATMWKDVRLQLLQSAGSETLYQKLLTTKTAPKLG